jgi:N-acetylglucosaminyldiphosphoundecaprenol N-acetyl-beta-D-mannosaminyltransferase
MNLAPAASRDCVHIGGLPIDRVTFDQAIDAVDALVAAGKGGSVFTPNVDHIVQYSEDERFRGAYSMASLSLADGMPVVWASRLLGKPLPEKVSGSDIVMPLVLRAAARGWRVFLLGGADGVGEAAKAEMLRAAPSLNVVGVLSPRIDLSQGREHRADIVEAVRATRPDLVLVAFGAPKQELFISEVQEALRPAVFVGIGATLDFVAGILPRAPTWMSDNGLEWMFRLAREPRRLWKRYLLRDPKFAIILLQTMRDLRTARG